MVLDNFVLEKLKFNILYFDSFSVHSPLFSTGYREYLLSLFRIFLIRNYLDLIKKNCGNAYNIVAGWFRMERC